MTLSISNAAAIAAANAIVDLLDVGAGSNGTLRIYDGTPPALVDDALSSNTLLAELPLSEPAFGAAADATPGATATAAAITSDSSANASGTATFARLFDEDDTAVIQVSLREIADSDNGEELVLQSKTISAGQSVGVSSLTFTMPEGA